MHARVSCATLNMAPPTPSLSRARLGVCPWVMKRWMGEVHTHTFLARSLHSHRRPCMHACMHAWAHAHAHAHMYGGGARVHGCRCTCAWLSPRVCISAACECMHACWRRVRACTHDCWARRAGACVRACIARSLAAAVRGCMHGCCTRIQRLRARRRRRVSTRSACMHAHSMHASKCYSSNPLLANNLSRPHSSVCGQRAAKQAILFLCNEIQLMTSC